MLSNISPFDVSIPSNFDADSIIPNGYKIAKKNKLRDGIHYFLDLLFPKPLERKKRKQLEETGFISLRADILKRIIGPEYVQIIALLTNEGVIKVNQHFILGQKTRGYQIEDAYFIETRKVEITNKGINKRYKNYKDEEREKQTAGLNIIPYITKWLNKSFISIDLTSAHDFIESYRLLMLKNLAETEFSSEVKKTEARYRIINRTYYQKYVVKMISDGVINGTRDAAGRLYTPFVNLKKELRSCVEINGQKIGSIDIKSSQPYLFLKLLDTQFWKTLPTDKITLHNISKKMYHKINGNNLRRNIITLLNNHENQYGRGLQELPFKKIHWEADFYEHVRGLVQRSTTDVKTLKSFADRSVTKKSVMLILYDIYNNKSTPYYTEFKRHFPVETLLMDKIKEHPAKGLFPTILQAVEAKLILEHCCKKISEQYPNLPLLTVHDSVACDVTYLEPVKSIIESSIMDDVGFKPGLKIEQIDKHEMLQNIRQTVDKDWRSLTADLGKNIAGADWVPSFNEEPKEIPLQYRIIKLEGKMQLDPRMMDPNPINYNWEELPEEEDYPDEYYWNLNVHEDD